MKKFTKLLSVTLALVLTVGFGAMNAFAASPNEMADQSYHEVLDNVCKEHGHEGFHLNIAEDEQAITAAAACTHVGTLKGTTYVGTCGSCRGPLYYVYCKVCGKYTGARICLC